MRKLGAFVQEIKRWMCQNRFVLYTHFESKNVALEALLANPFLTLFSNVIPMEPALKVLDRFIHFGQKILLEMTKSILKNQEGRLLQLCDDFELQHYLCRQVFLDAIDDLSFFPVMPEQLREEE